MTVILSISSYVVDYDWADDILSGSGDGDDYGDAQKEEERKATYDCDKVMILMTEIKIKIIMLTEIKVMIK